ncbi:hypothetical protein MHU86_6390 [Fragilaria crotonensis]|nr:hypothetical protein MHU86_6390 [Fragilaria crotonensis]
MSNKPVYVPPHKRKRFHGAFTGGFSAGYFNTVGTKEGWKPRESVVADQNAQDYMDDQDFDEWGGPTAVKRDYSASEDQKKPTTSVLDWSIVSTPKNVGTRLLRVLGWREGSAAYVPATKEDTAPSDDKNDEEAAVLSQKRLRKIRLQQNLVRIPPPKLDAGGLGYDVYRDAPEFQAHRDKRRREAKQRAHAATTSGGSNTYRLSDLHNDGNLGARQTNETDSKALHDVGDQYLSYETVHEFVGTKTAGGFALREDDDDVYDETPSETKAIHINKDEYDTEIYEHESDNDDPESGKTNLGGLLSSWATGDSRTSDRGTTSDGRQPFAGFCLGGTTAQVGNARFPGPEVPAKYVLKRHEFRDDEHPAKLQQVARQERVHERRQDALQRLKDPMAGGTFSGLAAAMKNRFTAATVPVTTAEAITSPVGLYRPVVGAKPKDASEDVATNDVKDYTIISKSYLVFYPELLVCKRLGVTPPIHSNSKPLEQKQNAESAFFEQEVMKRAAEAKPAEANTIQAKQASIIGSEADDDANDEVPRESGSDGIEVTTPNEQQVITSAMTTDIVPAGQTKAAREGVDDIDEERRRKKRKRKQREEKRRRSRPRSPTPSSSESNLDASSSDDEERRKRQKRRRKRKDEKKKRKKHKSSRRYED